MQRTEENMTLEAPVDLKCPICKGTTYRIRRLFFQRILVGSRRFECPTCHKRFLQFRDKVFGA